MRSHSRRKANAKTNEYLRGEGGELFKQFNQSVAADKQLQEQVVQLKQIVGEFHKLQNGQWASDQVVTDGIHNPQTVDQLKDTLQNEYNVKREALSKQQEAVKQRWISLIDAGDQLKPDGKVAPAKAVKDFNEGPDGARLRELMQSLGLPASETTTKTLQAKSALIDKALKTSASNPDLTQQQKDSLQLQAAQIKELIPLQNIDEGLRFLSNTAAATRLQLAQIFNSGELGLQPDNQALAAFRLTIEASNLDQTGGIRNSAQFANLLSETSKKLLVLSKGQGSENFNMNMMLDNLQVALTTQSKDPKKAEAAFQAATDASKLLNIPAFAGDLFTSGNNLKGPEAFAKSLGALCVKEASAKFYLDQNRVDKSASYLSRPADPLNRYPIHGLH